MEQMRDGSPADPARDPSSPLSSGGQPQGEGSQSGPRPGPPLDPGIAGLVSALRMLGIPADYDGVRHACGGETPDLT
ncbi:hypothetical protein ABTC40_18560, partial [Acinetobacter baumannii]